jgi:hypothetical protein
MGFVEIVSCMKIMVASPERKVRTPIAAIAHANPKASPDDAGKQRAHGVTQIAPETIDAKRTCPPGWMRGVRDGCEQRRVDHRGADSEQRGSRQPPTETTRCSRNDKACRLTNTSSENWGRFSRSPKRTGDCDLIFPESAIVHTVWFFPVESTRADAAMQMLRQQVSVSNCN